MMRGVKDSAVFTLFLTSGTTERYFVQLEIREAFRLRKPIIMIEETDDRFGKPDFAEEMKPVLHTDEATGMPILDGAQIAWLFSEVTAIPVRRQAHELPAFIDEVERQTQVAITGGGKRPPVELCDPLASTASTPSAQSSASIPSKFLTIREAADQVATNIGLALNLPLPQVVDSARTTLGIDSLGTLKDDLGEICAQLGIDTGWVHTQVPSEGVPPVPEPEPEPEPELTLLGWLSGFKLQSYASAIGEQGYDDLSFLRGLSETEVDELATDVGMLKGHAKRFKSELQLLAGSS
jgi:hypothetical protein